MAPKPWPALSRKRPSYPPLRVSLLRVVPTFFVLGACMELFMQKVPIGGRTFYDVALQKEVRARLPAPWLHAPPLSDLSHMCPVGAALHRFVGW